MSTKQLRIPSWALLLSLGGLGLISGQAAAALPASQQAPVLVGFVKKLMPHPDGGDHELAVEHALVSMRGTGSTVDSDTGGLFRLQLLQIIRPGQQIEVEVSNVPGWVLYEPAGGRLLVPLAPQTVTLRLLPRGSARFLEAQGLASLTQQMMSEAKDRARATSPRPPGSPPPPPPDLTESMQTWAETHGLKLAEVQSAKENWARQVLSQKTNDDEQVCLALYSQGQPTQTAACFHALGQDDEPDLQQLEAQTLERTERAVRRFTQAAEALESQYDFAGALREYQAAARWAKREVSAQLWAQVQVSLGIAHFQLGIRVEGEAAQQHLERAVAAYRTALTVYSRQALPQGWAMTQNDLGAALTAQASRTQGEATTMLRGLAVSAFHDALTVFTKQALPRDWAMTQGNLGNALLAQASQTQGEAATALLGLAVSALRDTLTVFTKQAMPQDWAKTQGSLGLALYEQASRAQGETATALLGQAVLAYRAAQTVLTQQEFPQDWAGTQNNLGNALREQASRLDTDDAAAATLLTQAVSAYRDALTVFSKQALPQHWAMTQGNLGDALKEQASRLDTDDEAAAALLTQAVTAYRDALTVYSKQALPQHWAAIQNNLANALQDQASRTQGEVGTALLTQAVLAYHDALTVYTQQDLPQHWAMTQNNLGLVLSEQARRLPAHDPLRREGLTQAILVHRAALTVYSQAQFPYRWVAVQKNLAQACALLPDKRCSADAIAAALQVIPGWWQGYVEAYELYHDQLFLFPQAHELTERWLAQRPRSMNAGEACFVQTHLTTGRWAALPALLAKVLPKISAIGQAPLLAIEVAALTGQGDALEAAQRRKALRALIAAQPADFQVYWKSQGTRHYIQTEPRLAQHKQKLLLLLAALEQPSRDAILAALDACCMDAATPP